MKRNEAIILGIILIILSVFVYFKDPSNGPILPCLFNKITGFYCPGCGMTRAVNSCFKFNLYQALRYNALLLIMPPMLGLYYLAIYFKKASLAKAILMIMLFIAIGYGILRNLPFFSFLAPL